jgi:dTDP-4-amino-4,6-dideoxygalactose transaminase
MTKLRIPFVDLKKINLRYKKKFLQSLNHSILNSNFIKGKKNKLLEKKISEVFKSKFSLTLNSGTDALIVAIKSLDFKVDDEIITTSNTWISSAYAIKLNNCKPKFIDVKLDNFQIDEKLIENAITKKTRAIIVTHLYGIPSNIEKINSIAKKNNLFLIEDIAQSHLAEYKKKIVGNFGDVACLSFYPTKNLGALGDGGAIITNNKNIYLKCRAYANYGSLDFRDADHKIIGLNSRLDEIQSYFLLEKLKHLKQDTSIRIKLAKIYDKKCDELKILRYQSNKFSKNVYHIYPIIIKNRNKVKKFLKSKGIETKIHYEIPIHKQTAFNYKKLKLPVTEFLAKNILSLPFYPGISKNEINYLFNNLKIALRH